VRLPLARVRRALGQSEEARHLLDDMLASAGNAVPALIERGRLDLDLKRPEDAERWLRRAVAVAPDDPDTHRALSDCLLARGKEAEARSHKETALELIAKEERRREDLRKRVRAVAKQ
jgi:Flp pilus assembly protein TadD